MTINKVSMGDIKLQPWQFSTLIGCIGALGMGTLMTFTNPSRNAYNTYAAEQASYYLQTHTCPKTSNYLGGILQEQCQELVDQREPQIQQLVDLSSRRHNYLLFSIYETELSIMESLPSYRAKTVGFLGNFWTYEGGIDLTQ